MRENGVSVGAGMEGLGWKRFMRKHWGIVPIFLAAGVVAFVGAVYVFLWFVGNAPIFRLGASDSESVDDG